MGIGEGVVEGPSGGGSVLAGPERTKVPLYYYYYYYYYDTAHFFNKKPFDKNFRATPDHPRPP